ncbi:nucleoporin protein Ndc1-Nup [Echria macrotheca]|uniref:Nucleoporin protein Ndc1-Nup n=1 Tax=Echria macrotheca TaxID=438768 RepID=A0AAJ0B410_9PEZI|nr:nucleoporin protein Ndc1-Nup [Echria macrotheca]
MAAAPVRRRLYKDVLQPALHRRFSTTLGLLTVVAYAIAVFHARWSGYHTAWAWTFWSWFPLGPAGGRTLLLLPVCFAIITLRIAQYHVGLRTSDSAFGTFLQHALKIQTAEALFTYGFCGFWFGQVYLWLLPDDAGFELVTYFMSDRARLNEKTLFFISHMVILGIYQGLLHLFRDTDRLALGVVVGKKDDAAENAKGAEGPWTKLMQNIPLMAVPAINQSLIGLLLSIVVYPAFVRGPLWRTMLFFLRPMYNLPRTNMLPSSLPYVSLRTLTRCFWAGMLLMAIIVTGNLAFSLFLAKEPLKNGKPLSSDSKDPNGCLLNGLKSKKDSIRCFAMWELAFIARDFPDQRKAIYEDIDRKDGPMWCQVYAICVEVLKSIETRIDNYGKTPVKAAETEEKVEPKKRTAPPPKDGQDIFQPTPKKSRFITEVETVVKQAATAPGQGPQFSPVAKKVLASGKDQLLKYQKEVTGTDPQDWFKEIMLKVLTSAAGWPFRQEYRRRLTKAVLGTPYAEPSLYINAASALTMLAEQSMKEDKYGNVQRDVAAIIRLLTSVTRKVVKFREDLAPHWTDVYVSREAPEVDEVLQVLRDCLGRLITEFGPYARDLRLSLADVRLAKEAAAVVVDVQREEMRQVR